VLLHGGQDAPAAIDRLLSRGQLRALGFERVERLRGNVGYIDLRNFYSMDRGGSTVATVMEVLANTDALIIDLRRHRGGDRATAALLSSFLFDTEPLYLDAEYWYAARRAGAPRAVPRVLGTRYVWRDVYLLVGRDTSPVAAAFARALQELRRAEVIGEAPRAEGHRDTLALDVPVAEGLAFHAAHLRALRRLREAAGVTSSA
jgi:C-terminal processing protease CtpA/Prc